MSPITRKGVAKDESGPAKDNPIAWFLQRLHAAEDVCLMYGWTSAGPEETDREKALFELWRNWYGLVGDKWTRPKNHPHLNDDVVRELAKQRDETRARTLEICDRLLRKAKE